MRKMPYLALNASLHAIISIFWCTIVLILYALRRVKVDYGTLHCPIKWSSIYIEETAMTTLTKISPIIEKSLHQKRLYYIGHYLKELRIDQGMTQYEAAILIGISRNCLQLAESGHNMTFLTLSKLTDFFELSLADFFTDME